MRAWMGLHSAKQPEGFCPGRTLCFWRARDAWLRPPPFSAPRGACICLLTCVRVCVHFWGSRSTTVARPALGCFGQGVVGERGFSRTDKPAAMPGTNAIGLPRAAQQPLANVPRQHCTGSLGRGFPMGAAAAAAAPFPAHLPRMLAAAPFPSRRLPNAAPRTRMCVCARRAGTLRAFPLDLLHRSFLHRSLRSGRRRRRGPRRRRLQPLTAAGSSAAFINGCWLQGSTILPHPSSTGAWNMERRTFCGPMEAWLILTTPDALPSLGSRPLSSFWMSASFLRAALPRRAAPRLCVFCVLCKRARARARGDVCPVDCARERSPFVAVL